jgi:hypothetical protein
VKATLINKDELLKPGAFIQLVIHLNEMKKSVTIPRTAILDVDTQSKDGKHDHIVYIRKGNHFIPRKVEVESHDSSIVEVLSGLNADDEVVTNGAYQLQYGESEDSHDGDHGHGHEKENNGIPLWIVIGIGTIGLALGILIGKKKKK